MPTFLIDSAQREEENFLITMLLMGAIFAFIAILITIIAAIIFVAAAAVLVGFGLVSTSVLVGVSAGSADKGLRFFFVACCILLGNVVFIIVSEFANMVLEYSDGYTALLYGILAGSIFGYGLGLLIYKAMSRLYRAVLKWVRVKFNRNGAPQ